MYLLEDIELRPEYASIPNWFWNELPAECPECGAPTQIQLNLTKLQCSDPRCPSKVAKRIETLLSDLGIKGIGDKGIRAYVDENDVTNPFEIFDHQDLFYSRMNEDADRRLKTALNAVADRGMKLYELVHYMHLPYISEKTSRKLFEGYDSIGDFYADMGYGEEAVDFVQDKLGIKLDGMSTQACNVKDSLEEFEEDLLQAEELFPNILKQEYNSDGTPVRGIRGVYTDKVRTPLANTKKDFARYIEDKYPYLNVEWDSSVTKDTDFVLTGTGKNTGKLVKAKKYGIPVFYSEEDFLDYIENTLLAVDGDELQL